MVKKFLKVAGVKTEAEFYKKYPSEAAFFKAHPEAKDMKQYKQGGQQKKLNQLTSFDGDIDNIVPMAQYGMDTRSLSDNSEIGYYTGGDVDDVRNIEDYRVYGNQLSQMMGAEKAQKDAQSNQLQSMLQNLGKTAKKGTKVPKLQNADTQGLGLNAPAGGSITGMGSNPYMYGSATPLGQTSPTSIYQAPPMMDPNQTGTFQQQVAGSAGAVKPGGFNLLGALGGAQGIGNLAGSIIGGIKDIKNAKQQTKDTEAAAKISELSLRAAKSRPEETRRRYVRPEDALIQPEQLFPSYGVGTNYLSRNGSTVKAQNGFGCKGKSKCITGSDEKKKDGISDKDGGGMGNYVAMSNAPATWEELQTYNETDPKSKEFKAQLKSLQAQFPGLTSQQLLAAGADSARVNLRKQNLQRYDQPSEQTFDRAYHMFYRPLMDQQKRVTVPQILQQQPGGFGAFEQNVRGNYGRPKAQDGMQIGGNLTEIQNMYNPGDLYSDLGYEPLNDSDNIKQYQGGGMLGILGGGSTSTPGFGGMTGADMGSIGTGVFNAAFGSSAESQLGGKIGSIFGPVGSIAGTMIGKVAGANREGRMKNAQQQIKANTEQLMGQSFGQGIQAQYSNYMKDGGWVSNDWLPQVITKFGEYDVDDLLKKDPMMDTLRTGGNITQNNMYPQDKYALGGELKTTWGGYTESMSHNPYLPGTGETVMFRGKSHDESDGNGHTGIGVKYGETDRDSYTDYAEFGTEQADADVEVERGEPAIEMIDESGEKNMVVYGNLKAPKQFLPKAEGKKFKNYVKGLSEKEDKINKSLDKDATALNNLKVYTPFDKLKLDSLNANLIGKNMKLKGIADDKMEAAAVQSAINDTAEEYGFDADALAKGKVKIDKKAQKEMAKYGKDIFKAQTGTTAPANFVGPTPDDYLENLYEKAKAQKSGELVEFFQKEFHRFYPKEAKEIILANPDVTSKGKKKGIKTIGELSKKDDNTILDTNVDKEFGERTEQYHAKLQQLRKPYTPFTAPALETASAKTTETTAGTTENVEPLQRSGLIDIANQILPYLRPSDADYNVDLTPEMMALANNQLEPVPAQPYQPQLLTPYDVSYQDQLNEVTAQTRAAERLVGNNPAAVAAIAADANRAKSSILGEQFRQNQAQKMGVYNQNINTLNDAQMKNLGIFDEQYKRQSTARSNTKAQALEAVKSMSDKIAKNKLENKTLQVYENLYNYRYDPSGRAINMNPLAQFDVTRGGSGKSGRGGLASGYEFTYDANGNIIGTRKSSKKDKDDDTGRNGRIVKAMKGF